MSARPSLISISRPHGPDDPRTTTTAHAGAVPSSYAEG